MKQIDTRDDRALGYTTDHPNPYEVLTVDEIMAALTAIKETHGNVECMLMLVDDDTNEIFVLPVRSVSCLENDPNGNAGKTKDGAGTFYAVFSDVHLSSADKPPKGNGNPNMMTRTN